MILSMAVTALAVAARYDVRTAPWGWGAIYPNPELLATLGFRVDSASGIWLAMNRSEATGSWHLALGAPNHSLRSGSGHVPLEFSPPKL